MKRNNGFTLIEMLVVIAIIAVLAAIAIPTAMNSSEKAREATDIANVRNAYALVSIAAMQQDETVSFGGYQIYNGSSCSAAVELTQKQADWQMDANELTIGGINAVTDKNIHWFDAPAPGGVCTVAYENGEINLYWGGKAHDYFSPLKKAATKGAGSYCLNSTCTGNGTISRVQGEITDAGFLDDIKTWAAVKTTKNANDFNYVISTIDITNLAEGTQVPAMFCDKNGNYTVGYATVKPAPDSKKQGNAYKVISYDANGQYAYTYDTNGSSRLNDKFDAGNMLTDSKTYTNLAAAQQAYKNLEKSYLGS